MSPHQPVRPLACPARFERATYALEGRNVIGYRSPLMADLRLWEQFPPSVTNRPEADF